MIDYKRVTILPSLSVVDTGGGDDVGDGGGVNSVSAAADCNGFFDNFCAILLPASGFAVSDGVGDAGPAASSSPPLPDLRTSCFTFCF